MSRRRRRSLTPEQEKRRARLLEFVGLPILLLLTLFLVWKALQA